MTKTTLPVPPKQYSAEFVRSDGRWTRQFVDGERTRTEMYGPFGLSRVSIGRLDLGLSWSYAPNESTAIEVPVTAVDVQNVARPEAFFDWEIGSSATIQGREAVEYRGRFKANPEHVAEVIYFDREHGLPLLTTTFNTLGAKALEITAREVRVGPVETALFELPEGYAVQRVSVPRRRKRHG